MVNTELETTTMSTNASNTESATKAPPLPGTPVKPVQADPVATKVKPETTEVEPFQVGQVTYPKIENHTTPVPIEVVEVAGAVTRELDQDETKANPSNQTPPLSDTPYKRIQSTFNAVNSKVVYLVHWENNVHSGAVLGSILGFLFLTAYSSLFNLFCGVALLAIGCDWIYVLATKQFKTILNQKAVNPHEKYLENPPQIRREDLDKYVDIWVDIINLSLVEATKIALIENPLRSIKYLGILYGIWTIASWFSFHTITAIVVITAFVVPKFYKKNQDLVNQHLDKATVLAQGYIDRGVDVVSKNTGDFIPMVQKFAKSKGWIANSDAAKKQE